MLNCSVFMGNFLFGYWKEFLGGGGGAGAGGSGRISISPCLFPLREREL